ncbi:Sulfate/thiosulfate import ATP-binding protein CysA [Planctomycetes bacterium Pla163]|uniref:Sulfate/thiosulfate import ATP-binding protein CysA n=1 Tax=Rohdeia mirabilis TaxID=2528008 RepID=A0A518D4J2_9BACT|nr:Sulfate/thiosulfate import ATP-binding protein CysA [Planctomycetes bacterium Pla163]
MNADQGRGVEAELRLTRPGFELDVDLAVAGGCITSVVGPSGAGKTTLLRCLAGLERDVRGRIVVAGETWLDASRALPTHRRRLGFVFQDASLFGHLDVRGNLRYGERRVPRDQRRAAFDEVVAWLELDGLLERRVHGLSGGERQRVALGRALLASPSLLLIDEPLSALDAAARERILPWLEDLPARFAAPVLHVSHSLREVARLARDLVWLEDGRVREAGPARELLPLVGSTDDELAAALRGTLVEHHDDDGLSAVDVDGVTFFVRRVDAPLGSGARLLVQARDVSVALEADSGSSILNEVPVVLARVRRVASGAILELDTPRGQRLYARITRRSLRLLALDRPEAVGRDLFARVKSVGVAPSGTRAS